MKKQGNQALEYLDVAEVIFPAIDSYQKVILINKNGCEVLGYAQGLPLHFQWQRNYEEHIKHHPTINPYTHRSLATPN